MPARFFIKITEKMPREMLGMLCAFFAFLCYSLQDAIISVTARVYPSMQIIWLNAVVVLGMLLGVIAAKKGWGGMKAVLHTHQLKWHLVRGLLLAVGIVLSLTAVSLLPLPNFYTIIFMSPLLAVSFSGFFLKERVGFRKSLALVAGFSGVYLALQPGREGFDHNSLYAVGAALLFATTVIMTRFLGRKDGASVLVFYPQLLLVILFAVPAALVFRQLSWAHWALVLLTGLFSVLAFSLNANAYRMAPIYLIAPCQFMQFLWGTLAQFFLHGTVPQKNIVFGAGLIIFSNLLIIYLRAREARRSEKKTAVPS